MRRCIATIVILLVSTGFGCGEDTSPPASAGADADAGGAGMDVGQNGVTADAREQPESPHEVTFLMKNATGNKLYMQKGPGCLSQGPGWVVVESRYQSETKFLTSSCSSCSCDNPEMGIGCGCDCPESQQKQQIEIRELPAGKKAKWTWSGKIYTASSGNQCSRSRLPPANRLIARFCWKSEKDAAAPEQCAPVKFKYDDTGRLTATIEPS